MCLDLLVSPSPLSGSWLGCFSFFLHFQSRGSCLFMVQSKIQMLAHDRQLSPLHAHIWTPHTSRPPPPPLPPPTSQVHVDNGNSSLNCHCMCIVAAVQLCSSGLCRLERERESVRYTRVFNVCLFALSAAFALKGLSLLRSISLISRFSAWSLLLNLPHAVAACPVSSARALADHKSFFYLNEGSVCVAACMNQGSLPPL